MICPYCDGDGEFIDLGYSPFSEYPIDIRAECPMCEGRKKVDPKDAIEFLDPEMELFESDSGTFAVLICGIRVSGVFSSAEDACAFAFEYVQDRDSEDPLMECVSC